MLTLFALLFRLETELSSYRRSNESWEEAKALISQSSDPVLQYFGCSVYEDWIACRWKLVPDENKADLGQFLFNFIVNNYKVRNCSFPFLCTSL